MPSYLARWLTPAVLTIGIALRAALAFVTPPEWAHDDHFRPIAILVENRRLPGLAECWECYQPPLYYLVAAGPFVAGEALAPPAEPRELYPQPEGSVPRTALLARRLVQQVSVVAGGLTLWFALLILRRACRPAPATEALSLSVIAFLPEHIYMSAMATNDALTYLLATIAVYAALRARTADRPAGWIAAGAWAGAAVLSKIYGAVTVAALLIACGWEFFAGLFRKADKARDVAFKASGRRTLCLLLSALLVGAWPTLRTLTIMGEPHVDNFRFFPDTPMRFHPPGSLSKVEFHTFRLSELLAHPWLHSHNVNSFWTELYGRFWFDYEGFHTLRRHAPWQAMWERIAELHPEWSERRVELLLNYPPEEMPRDLAAIGVWSYIAGLFPTVLLLVGVVIGIWRLPSDFAARLLVLHLFFALLVPIAQTLRLPHFAAMKAAFALSAISSVPVLIAFVLQIAPRRMAAVFGALLALCMFVLLGLNACFVAWFLMNPEPQT